MVPGSWLWLRSSVPSEERFPSCEGMVPLGPKSEIFKAVSMPSNITNDAYPATEVFEIQFLAK